MGYIGSRNTFQNAKDVTNDKAIQELADGLIQLSRAIEEDMKKIERAINRR